MNIKIVFNKFILVKEKIMEQVYRIGIDHGYGNIKTAHHIFESGVIERGRASELAEMTIEFEGKLSGNIF